MKNILIMGNLWMLKVFKRFTAREPASRRQVEEVLRFLNIINAAFKGSKFFNVHPKKYFVMACLKTNFFLHGQSSKVQSCRWCNPPKHSIRLHWKKKKTFIVHLQSLQIWFHWKLIVTALNDASAERQPPYLKNCTTKYQNTKNLYNVKVEIKLFAGRQKKLLWVL